MPLRLILTRHAKSSWDDPHQEDIDRDLNPRGQRDAQRIGRWLASGGHHPDQALVSAACRTQETWSLIRKAAEFSKTDRTVFEGLYLASSDSILQHLRKATAQTVIVIAHNPGIGDFASHFAHAPASHPDFARYPTCATTVFDVAADNWSEAQFGVNTVLNFCVPRDLQD